MSAVSQRAEHPLGARPRRARMADPVFLGTLAAIAGLVLVLIVFFFIFLLDHARPALSHQGVFSFVFTNDYAALRPAQGELGELIFDVPSGATVTDVVDPAAAAGGR